MNANDPNPGNPTEEKQSELEQFIDNATLIMGVLGHPIFEPLDNTPQQPEPQPQDDDLRLHLQRRVNGEGTITAQAIQTPEGIVVKQGSTIARHADDTIPKNIAQKRATAPIKDGILQEDQLFPTPSAAANFVIGKSANGWQEWKTPDGKPLKEHEA